MDQATYGFENIVSQFRIHDVRYEIPMGNVGMIAILGTRTQIESELNKLGSLSAKQTLTQALHNKEQKLFFQGWKASC